MQVTLFSGDDVVAQFALAPDEYMVVGSDADTEIQLDDDSVSGKPATIPRNRCLRRRQWCLPRQQHSILVSR